MNIHKGFSSGNFKFTLKKLKDIIRLIRPDLICLQEVQGEHVRHRRHFPGTIRFSQLEYLAEGIWPHLVYGKNAIYTQGHHGNAILSRFPIKFWENQDVSTSPIERRGLLHAVIDLPKQLSPLHLICSHLGLFETDRLRQIRVLCHRIQSAVPDHEPLLVAGDFNDWRQKVSPRLMQYVGLREAFLESQGEHAKSFPSWLPVFRLDRVYFRGLQLNQATCLNQWQWSRVSDHLALLCEFQI